MASLRDIRKRMSSVQSTKQVTHTMQMVATAKVRSSMDRVAAANPYADAIRGILKDLANSGASVNAPLLTRHDATKNVIIIAVTSDRGLAGGFNSNVVREAEKYAQKSIAEGANVDVIACGKKAIAYFNYRGMKPLLTFAGTSADPTSAQASEIAAMCIEKYSNGSADEVVLIYNHAKNAADQQLRVETCLPVELPCEEDGDALNAEGGDAAPVNHSGYEFEPSEEEVLEKLLPAYVNASIYHALIDSAAGEQGARRKAMMAATDNATEMLETLSRVYNRVRQGAITTEISEIVGGAAAMEE